MKPIVFTTFVYSSESGRICFDCTQPVAQCQCAANKRALVGASGAAADGVVRVLRETRAERKKDGAVLVRALV